MAGKVDAFTPPPPCRWWNRWIHRGRRKADELPAIKARAGEKFRAAQAFASFTGQRGQEHWQCQCSDADYDRVMGDLTR